MSEKNELSRNIQELLIKLLRQLCSEINLGVEGNSVRYPHAELELLRLLNDGGYVNMEHAKIFVHQELVHLGLFILRRRGDSEISVHQKLIGYALKHATEEQKKNIRFISAIAQTDYRSKAEGVLEKMIKFLFVTPASEFAKS